MITIVPKTELEGAITRDSEFQKAMDYEYPVAGRAESSVGEHVSHLLGFIARLNQDATSTRDLRLLALLHDVGKFKTERNEHGRLIGKSHAMLSEEFAHQFIKDPHLLDIIRHHDRYYRFFREERKKGKFNYIRFLKIYRDMDLDLLTRFNYVDSCERGKDSIIWFEHRARDLNLTCTPPLYIREPELLTPYSEL